jgi:hypothetical protein
MEKVCPRGVTRDQAGTEIEDGGSVFKVLLNIEAITIILSP